MPTKADLENEIASLNAELDKKAKKPAGNTISHCNIQMDMQADGATQILANALLAQAEANEATSDAMMQLAKTLKPIDVFAIRITCDGIDV